MGFLSKFFSGRKSSDQITTVDRPFRILNPTIGFLNLQGDLSATLSDNDHKILAPLFKESFTSTNIVPKCEILFLYCTIDAQGKVVGSTYRIRQLIKDAGAYIAVVASDNHPDAYIQALESTKDWNANIVLAIDRKADKLAIFFRRLFQAMFHGQSMLMAWVELAPQIPGYDDPDAPCTIMAAEAGHVTFAG